MEDSSLCTATRSYSKPVRFRLHSTTLYIKNLIKPFLVPICHFWARFYSATVKHKRQAKLKNFWYTCSKNHYSEDGTLLNQCTPCRGGSLRTGKSGCSVSLTEYFHLLHSLAQKLHSLHTGEPIPANNELERMLKRALVAQVKELSTHLTVKAEED
jgi:hypothetical protein